LSDVPPPWYITGRVGTVPIEQAIKMLKEGL